jgi:hypothetical protein
MEIVVHSNANSAVACLTCHGEAGGKLSLEYSISGAVRAHDFSRENFESLIVEATPAPDEILKEPKGFQVPDRLRRMMS